MPRTRLGMGVRDEAHQPPKDLIGKTVLERYLVEAELGSGAMGTVFRGRHISLPRPVAIKVMHAHLGDEPLAHARFEREARSAARLRHPNVVSVLDVGDTHGRRVMVLEFAEGPTLAELITGPMPEERVIHLTAHILRGLDHAHAAGLVHRDLKPENVIVSHADDGTELPRLVDFGIAILRAPDEGPDGARLTGAGMVVGTPAYMAPEQARGEQVDPRADLFSLGVMVYEMLSGVLPFDGSPMEVAIAYMKKEVPTIAARADVAVHPVLELYARRLMARRADDRLPGAHDALLMLELIARDPSAAHAALLRDPSRAAATIGLPTPRR